MFRSCLMAICLFFPFVQLAESQTELAVRHSVHKAQWDNLGRGNIILSYDHLPPQNSAILFRSITRYETGGADRFSFEARLNASNPPREEVLAWKGKRGSGISENSIYIDLPDFVTVKRRATFFARDGNPPQLCYFDTLYFDSKECSSGGFDIDVSTAIDLEGGAPSKAITVALPPFETNYNGITIVEVLAYHANGDADYSYRISHNCMERHPRISIQQGFDSNSQADIVLRITQMQWEQLIEPEMIEAGCVGPINLAVINRGGSRQVLTSNVNPDEREKILSLTQRGTVIIPLINTYWTHKLNKFRGTSADNDMSYDLNLEIDQEELSLGGSYLAGSRTKKGNIAARLYWIKFKR